MVKLKCPQAYNSSSINRRFNDSAYPEFCHCSAWKPCGWWHNIAHAVRPLSWRDSQAIPFVCGCFVLSGIRTTISQALIGDFTRVLRTVAIADDDQGNGADHAGNSSYAGYQQIDVAIENAWTALTSLHYLRRWRISILGECNKAELRLRNTCHIVCLHSELIERRRLQIGDDHASLRLQSIGN